MEIHVSPRCPITSEKGFYILVYMNVPSESTITKEFHGS